MFRFHFIIKLCSLNIDHFQGFHTEIKQFTNLENTLLKVKHFQGYQQSYAKFAIRNIVLL